MIHPASRLSHWALLCALLGSLVGTACGNRAPAPIRVTGLPPGSKGILSITTPPPLRGGITQRLEFTTISGVTISRLAIDYEQSPGNSLTIIEPSVDATSALWSVPLDNTSEAKLRIRVEVYDKKSNKLYVADASSQPFTIDSLPPQAMAWRAEPPLVRATPNAVFAIESCFDGVGYFISPSDTAPPQAADARWLSCTVLRPTIAFAAAGANTFRAWSRDAVGNTQEAAPIVVTYDASAAIAPVLTPRSNAITNDPVFRGSIDNADLFSTIALITNDGPPSDFLPTGDTTTEHVVTLPNDGTHRIQAIGGDEAGNLSPVSNTVQITLDRQGPSVVLEPFAAKAVRSQTAATLRFAATDTQTAVTRVVVSVSENNGASFVVMRDSSSQAAIVWPGAQAPSNGATMVRFSVQAFDEAGNSTTVVSPALTVTDVRPMSPTLFLLNGSATPPRTANPTAAANLTVPTAGFADITHVCWKRVPWPGTPAVLQGENDPCFRRVDRPPYDLTLSNSLALSEAPVPLGFLRQTMRVFAWVKNEAGLTSAMSNPDSVGPAEGTSGVDAVTITYDPGEPPAVVNVNAGSVDNLDTAAGDAAYEVNPGDDVFIKWNATFPTVLGVSNGPGPVSLWYTTDDIHYELIADNVSAVGNTGGCTTNVTHNGCYRWVGGAVSNQFFRVQVRVEDGKGLTTVASGTPPLNSSRIRFLVGNTEGGIGGSASSVPLSHGISSPRGEYINQAFAVSSRGTIFFVNRQSDNAHDVLHGNLLWINPDTGNVDVLLARVANASDPVQDGCVASAGTACTEGSEGTIGAVAALAVDYQDRVVFRDGPYIRRIDILPDGTPLSVHTLVGQGLATVGQQQGAAPAEVRLEHCTTNCALVPLPNGDVLFAQSAFERPDGSFTNDGFSFYGLRRYVADPVPHVDYLQPAGTLPVGPAATAANVARCAMGPMALGFNPETSAIDDAVIQFFDGAFYGNNDCSTVSYQWFNSTLQAQPEETRWPDAHAYAGITFTSGMDGKIYAIDTYANRAIYRRAQSSTWELVVGADAVSTAPLCQDGSLVASGCAVTPQGMFVDVFGRVFFTQLGSLFTVETLGTSDTADDQVKRVAGRALDFGDGGAPLSARLPMLAMFDQYEASGRAHVIVADSLNHTLREAEESVSIQRRAGNGEYGSPDNGSALGQPLALGQADAPFMVDASTHPGDVYYTTASGFFRLPAGGSNWQRVIGGVAGTYLASAPNGTDGLNIALSGTNVTYSVLPVAIENGHLYAATYGTEPSGCFADSLMSGFAIDDNFSLQHFSGQAGVSNTCNYNDPGTAVPAELEPYQYFCGNYLQSVTQSAQTPATYDDDAPVSTCHLALHANWRRNRASYDSVTSQLIVMPGTSSSTSRLFAMGTNASGAPVGNVTYLTTTDANVASYAYRRHTSGRYLYYCPLGASEQGVLRRRDLATGTEVALPWPVARMACHGDSMYWNEARGAVMFGYRLGNFFGVAEYKDPDPTL